MGSRTPDVVDRVGAKTSEPGTRMGSPLADVVSSSGSPRDPLILAFVSSLATGPDDLADEADVERIRAEVRGLGVTLLMMAPDSAWCFGPDDGLRKISAPAELDGNNLTDLFDRFKVPTALCAARVSTALQAVFVIDPDYVVRLAHACHGESSWWSSGKELLLRALVAASTAFERRRTATRIRPSFSELTTLAVIDGLERVLAHVPVASEPSTRLARDAAGVESDRVALGGEPLFGLGGGRWPALRGPHARPAADQDRLRTSVDTDPARAIASRAS